MGFGEKVELCKYTGNIKQNCSVLYHKASLNCPKRYSLHMKDYLVFLSL